MTKADNIVVPTDAPPPPWMIELAEALRILPHDLPRGVIVGSAVVEKCVRKGQAAGGMGQGFDDSGSPLAPDPSPLFIYEWHLADVEPREEISQAEKPPAACLVSTLRLTPFGLSSGSTTEQAF